MFEGDSAGTCVGKCPRMLMGGKGLVSADLGVRVVGGLWLESEYCDLLWLSFLSQTQD